MLDDMYHMDSTLNILPCSSTVYCRALNLTLLQLSIQLRSRLGQQMFQWSSVKETLH